MQTSRFHVAVLMGGSSSERGVSLESGNACAESLERQGFLVSRVDANGMLDTQLRDIRPNVVFNMLHGGMGGNGTVQALLELLGLPYTHSGVLASALATRKDLTRIVLSAHGVPVPHGVALSRFDVASRHVLTPPYVIKPLAEGSSLGIVFVIDGDSPPPTELAAADWLYGDTVLCERYIPGRELSCGVMGNKSLGVIEKLMTRPFNDFVEKTELISKTLLPAPLPDHVYREIQRLSLVAHQAIGCRGVSRVDFRYDDSREGLEGIFCLEVNNQPGMKLNSHFPALAAHAGITFDQLTSWIVQDASIVR